MTITVKFFATFRELAGTGDLEMPVGDATTIADVIEQLEQQYPQFGGKLNKIALIAVNEKYAHRKSELQPGDTLAFFPPVSGG